MAVEHVCRAGLLWGWSLRLFLMIASVVAGIVHPLAMLPVRLLLVALHYFDQPADLELESASV